MPPKVQSPRAASHGADLTIDKQALVSIICRHWTEAGFSWSHAAEAASRQVVERVGVALQYGQVVFPVVKTTAYTQPQESRDRPKAFLTNSMNGPPEPHQP